MQFTIIILTLTFLTSASAFGTQIPSAHLILKPSENGQRSLEILGNECNSGIFFKVPERFSCFCLTGMWAFYNAWCAVPVTIIAGINYCQELSDIQLTQVSLLSSNLDPTFPTLTRVTPNVRQVREIVHKDLAVDWTTENSSFITSGSNAKGWEITTRSGDRYCLVHNYTAAHGHSQTIPFYCFFDYIGDYEINHARLGCSSDTEELIEPDYCTTFIVGKSSDRLACFSETETLEKVWINEKKHDGGELMRLKRMGQIANATKAPLLPYNDYQTIINQVHQSTSPVSLLKINPDQSNYGTVELPSVDEESELNLKLEKFKIATEMNENPIQDTSSMQTPIEEPTGIAGVITIKDDVLVDSNLDQEPDDRSGDRELIADSPISLAVTQPDYSEAPFTENTTYPDTTTNVPDTTFTTESSKSSSNAQETTPISEIESTTDQPAKNCLDPKQSMELDCEPGFEDLELHLVKSNPMILNYLVNHVEKKIGSIVGNRAKIIESETKWPSIRIMEMALEVMKKTCKAIPLDFLEMALDTFMSLQIQSLHIKEPYISHPVFFRIENALENCLISSKPHEFVTNTSSIARGTNCHKELKPSSKQILRNGKIVNLELPEDREGKGFEPIIETIWKVFVNSHSYCYKFFSDYFNDHHSFTVSLLPFFNNEIQKIWMPVSLNGTFVEPNINLQLYGGLIGDHGITLRDIDNCVAASRISSGYPWDMNRPSKDETKKWRRRRRRRSIEESKNNHFCLKSPDDPISLFSLQECIEV